MPTIIALLVALLVGNLLLILALASRRPSADRSAEAAMPVSGEPVELAIEMARDPEGRPASGAGIRLATYDRVIRIVSYTFFMVTAVVVAASGLWPDSAPAIYLLLLAGTATVFVLHEVAPRLADVESLFLIEGAAGVTFFTLLVMLTGGVTSPFFFGYFLVVAAAALVTGGGASLVLAAAITAAYLGGLLLTRTGSLVYQRGDRRRRRQRDGALAALVPRLGRRRRAASHSGRRASALAPRPADAALQPHLPVRGHRA